jgi:hypothetical protein
MYRNRDHLAALADRCETAATQLTYEGDHAAEVLAERGYPDADAQDWAARKHAAAAAAREYAAGLRAEAADMSNRDRPSEERIEQAEKVALAAELGGILIDGRPQAEATATADNAHIWHQADKQAWEAGTHPAQTKAAAVEGSGMFAHVADEGQVPFWQLSGHRDRTDADATENGSTSTDMRCSECAEPAVNRPPTTQPWASTRTEAHQQPLPEWSHTDGEPLCPVVGEHGYEPAQPVPANQVEDDTADEF